MPTGNREAFTMTRPLPYPKTPWHDLDPEQQAAHIRALTAARYPHRATRWQAAEKRREKRAAKLRRRARSPEGKA